MGKVIGLVLEEKLVKEKENKEENKNNDKNIVKEK